MDNGQCLRTLTGHKAAVFSLAVSRENLLFSGQEGILLHSGDIYVWNIDTGVHLKTLKGHSLTCHALVFDNENHLISGSSDETIKGRFCLFYSSNQHSS
jgi:WD40 repeat protein